MNDNCISCGEYIPEGMQVCLSCSVSEGININKVEMHQELCNRLNTIYAHKNNDYGDSFAKLRNEIPDAILVRIYDKYSRLKTLLEGKEQKVKDESIDDTLIDLANYCIMELIEREL